MRLRYGVQARLHLLNHGPGHLQLYLTVSHEDERRPELHAERSPQRPASPVGDANVSHLGMLLEKVRQLRLEIKAIPSPGGAELEQHGPAYLIHFVAAWLRAGVIAQTHVLTL